MPEMNNVRDVSDYLYCARKVYLRKTRKIKEKLNVKMARGIIRHEIFDEFNKSERYAVSGIMGQKNISEIGEIYRDYLHGITERVFRRNENLAYSFSIGINDFWQDFWKNAQREIQPRVKAVFQLVKKNVFGNELWDKLEPKYLTEFKIVSDKLKLIGRIDRIEIHNHEGKAVLIPHEIKNSNVLKPYESDILQLACYAMLLENELDKEVKEGVIDYKNKSFRIEVDEDKKQKVMEILGMINRFPESGIPKILDNFKKCEKCGLKEECFAEK